MNDQQTVGRKIEAWFLKEGFQKLQFEGPTERITTHSSDHTLVHKLRRREGHDSFYKESTGGSLIVFEVSTRDAVIQLEGYCPLLIFGIWERKLPFKANAGTLTSYRKEGHLIEERFKAFLNELYG